ncbi:ATP-dependent nuclease [Acinetobacter ursingii]|uniref:ATP-dependent nuclease n=1 Tax=Acinetobacter ursingii TaxID=108980 RepID=UPI00124F8B8D|nr:AAA family ATPase [Acinetobacter ursingii]
MILIEKLTIKNYKSCVDTTINLNAFSALVGYNNAGKTNILSAITQFVENQNISIEDFNNSTQPVEIIATISGFGTEELSLIENDGQRNSIIPIIQDGKLLVRFYQTPNSKSKSKLSIRPVDESQDWNNPNGIDNALKTLLPSPIVIYSMQDANEDVGKSKASNTLGKLLKILAEKIIEESLLIKIQELNNLVLGTENTPRLQGLNEFEESVTGKLTDFFPDLKLELTLEATTLSDMLAKSNLKVYELGQQFKRNFQEVGHGAQRSIQMALIRQLAEYSKVIPQKSQIILIDEPELYLHPQAIEIVRDALENLSRVGYQIIFSTHSPFMIQKEHILNTNIIRKTNHKTYALPRICESIANDTSGSSNILFEINNLSQILFTDRILIIEGTTEEIVLPTLFEKICNKRLEFMRISLIKANGSGSVAKIVKIAKLMNLDYIAVVDLDFAFKVAHQQTYSFIPQDHQSFSPCKQLLQNLENDAKLYLGEDGYPRNGKTNNGEQSISAAQGFELLAELSDAENYLLQLHNDLKEKKIWLWKSGAIENYLCLAHKASNEWHSFKQKIVESPRVRDLLHQPNEVLNFICWVTGFKLYSCISSENKKRFDSKVLVIGSFE